MTVYKVFPALAESKRRKLSRLSPGGMEHNISSSAEPTNMPSQGEEISGLEPNRRKNLAERVSTAPFLGAWIVYLRQHVLLPGVALALLYFTVLSYLRMARTGIPTFVIGIARGISAMVGIGATFVYPVVQSRIPTLRTVLWSIWYQDDVCEADRCIVGGVQNSLQSTMDVLGYVMGIIISKPQDIVILAGAVKANSL
ncbi:hypothetical protein Tsubulata_010828 [Turnera subulata]|uniref:Solute carrier family 40 member n=1 Tax=Turnera subulata TaxID=218843 RepID=A0A9Q0JKJ8_9ROSI|nr:hypothetical protein Tsubulata_010828 [Turnera subulata]